MPRKKCYQVNKGKISQMKTIKSRLIKIRMKVENYIYKQETITRTQAKTLLDEISSYKPQCDGNVECLQVIEKLTKHMKIVIANEDALVADNNINDVVNNIGLNTNLSDEFHDISRTSPPVFPVAKENVSGNQNLFQNNQINNFDKDKENIEDLTSNNNKIDTNLQVEGINSNEETKMNSIQLSGVDLTRAVGIDTNEILGIKSIGPLVLRKTVNNNLCTEDNSQTNLSKTIDTIATRKRVIKAQKPDIVTEISQQLSVLNFKNVLTKTNIKNKTCVVQDTTEKSANKTQEQTSKLIQVLPCTQFIQPSYPNITKKLHIPSVNSEEPQTEILRKKKIKSNTIHSDMAQNEIIIKNIVQEKSGNNLLKKSVINKTKTKQTNKRKIKKESGVHIKGKRIKKAEKKDKELKRKVNKIKSHKNAKDDKSAKTSKKDDSITLDLSWFDSIKYVREVDETEYFTKKNNKPT